MGLYTQTYDQLKNLADGIIGRDITGTYKNRFDSLINQAARQAYTRSIYWPRWIVFGEPRTVSRGIIDPSEDSYHVFGGGFSDANGLYVRNGTADSNPKYSKYTDNNTENSESYNLAYDSTGTQWEIFQADSRYISLDGTDDCISTDSALSLTNGRVIKMSCAFRIGGSLSSNGYLVSTLIANTADDISLYVDTNDRISVNIDDGTNTTTVTNTSATVNIGSWNYAVMEYNSVDQQVFITLNGTTTDHTVIAGTNCFSSPNGACTVGCRVDSSLFFDGEIDSAKIDLDDVEILGYTFNGVTIGSTDGVALSGNENKPESTFSGGTAFLGGGILYYNDSTSSTPPETGWLAFDGETPAPQLNAVAEIDTFLRVHSTEPYIRDSARECQFYSQGSGIYLQGFQSNARLAYVTYRKRFNVTYGDGTGGTTSAIPEEWAPYMAHYAAYIFQRSEKQLSDVPNFGISLRLAESTLEDALEKIDRQGVFNNAVSRGWRTYLNTNTQL